MNREHPRITVFGVGGVGGILAGPLIRHYGNDVSLIARGDRKRHLREKGLTLESDLLGTFTVRPGTVTEDPAQLPEQDIVFICVKNDALEKAADMLKPVIGENTVVIPVMNGVTAHDVLQKKLDRGIILSSVIYTVSLSGPDYTLIQKGKFTRVIVGSMERNEFSEKAAEEVAEIIGAIGLTGKYSDRILSDIWDKYILNCAYNVVTARWGCDIGEVKRDPEKRRDYRKLMEEAREIGIRMGAEVPESVIDDNMRRLDKTSDDSTSSLSRDFADRKKGELEIFSGYIYKKGKELQIPTPATDAYYEAMLQIAADFR